jgi:hypothetical protein
MTDMDKIARFAFVLLAPVAFASGAHGMAADPMPTEVGEVATPNHDPHHLSLMQAVATPNHDPHHLSVIQEVATPNHDPHHVSVVQAVATPNHDPHHLSLMQAAATAATGGPAAWTPVLLRAEPEAAAPSAPAFVAADNMLYARADARLRRGPSLAAGVLAKLAASTPLRAIARSTDGAWWRVSLAGGRTGYVHRDALAEYGVAKTKPPAMPPASVVAASVQPAPARRSQGPLGLVEDAMNWLADMAGHGTPPKIIRTER